MGKAASQLKECHLEVPKSSTALTTDNIVAIHERQNFDFRRHTFFTKVPVLLEKDLVQKFQITVNGGAVLRIGLLDEQPRQDDFFKKAIFEEEDGFGCGSSTRRLYRNPIGYIQYGPPDEPREYLQLTETLPLWVYVIVIYGSPKITATFNDSPVQWAAFDDTNIRFPDDPPTQAVCGLETVSEKCAVSEKLEPDHTYRLRWDMRLDEAQVADRPPLFGFMRIAIVDKEPTNLASLSMNLDSMDDSVVWCSESAVRCYPYSGTIAVHLGIDAANQVSITHNLLMDSVGTAVITKKIPVKEEDKGNLQLVVEMSCGSLRVAHGANVHVAQSPASIFHVKKYKEFDTERKLVNDIGRLGHTPCRIMYGADPTSFVVEFNNYVPSLDERVMKSSLTTSISRLNEPTSTIQVLDVPDEWPEWEVKIFFSDEKSCGGGAIKSVTQEDGIWIIEYPTPTVARRVYMTDEYSYKGDIFKVLPYYKELGCTVNSGHKPVYDMDPLFVSLDKFDQDKVSFVRERPKEVEKLKDYLKQNANISMEWKQTEPKEFECDEDDDDEDDEVVTLRCDYTNKDFEKLEKWKENAQSALDTYFADEVKGYVVQVDANKWGNVRSMLETTSDFAHTENKTDGTIKLISSDITKLKEVSDEIGNVLPDIERKTEVLRGKKAKKFFVLDSYDKVDDLGNKYINTRVSKDRSNEEVAFTGPKEEVDELMKDIHKRLFNIRSIAVTISASQEQVCRNAESELSSALKLRIGTDTFQLSKRSISVSMYFEKDTPEDTDRSTLQSCINELVQNRTLSLKANEEHVCSKPSWNTFVENTHIQFASCITVNHESKTVRICALNTQIDRVYNDVQQFLNLRSMSTEIVYKTRDIAEYIDDKGLHHGGTITVDKKGEEYTGKVLIQGDKSTQRATKQFMLDETTDIKTFWFTIEQDWLASVIEEISLNQISKRHSSVITTNFGDTLAVSGVPAVAVMKTSGVAVLVKQASITEMAVDAVVSAADLGLKTESRIAHAIVRTGGQEIHLECAAYVKRHGNDGLLQEGAVVMTTAGVLPCCKVIHAVMPCWQDGNSNEDEMFISAIQKVLQTADGEHFSTVAIPVLSYGTNKYPLDKACDYTMAAVKDYVEKVRQTSLATVYLCDLSKASVDKLTSALEKTLKGGAWTFFKHDKPLSLAVAKPAPQVSQDEPARPCTPARPRTAGRLRWKPDDDIQLRQQQARVVAAQAGSDSEGSDDESDTRQNDVFTGGLPFNIEITNKLRLNIVKGQIDTTKVDAIVCPTFHFPDLSGTLYNSLKKAAGPQFEQECRALKSLEYDEVKRVGGGDLPCQHVYVTKIETNWTDNSWKRIYDLVMRSLDGASRYGVTSIAFPTFGTGYSKYPVEKVADAMITSIRKFASNSPNTSLKEISIVVYYQDVKTIGVLETCVPPRFKPQLGAAGKSPKGHGQRPRQTWKPLRYKKPSKPSVHGAVDDFVMFKVISKVPGTTIQKDVEQLVKEECITREIEFEFDEKEDRLSQDETTKLKHLAGKNGVQISIETRANQPIVILSGLRSKVLKAQPIFNDVIIRSFAYTRQKKKMAERIKSQYQWLYEENGIWKEVGVDCLLDLHMGYLKGEDFTYKNGALVYKVIVKDLVEHPVKTPRQRRNIRLKEGTSKGIEKTWNMFFDDNKEQDMISFLQRDLPPAKSEVQRAFELHSVGCLTTNTFEAICQTICQKIQNSSDRISSVRTYVTALSRKVVFVAMADRKLNLLVPYDVRICHPESYSEEALDITYHDKRQNKQFTENELKEIPETIQNHSQYLFENHSNIQMISGCSVRSRGFGTDNATIDLQTCIVIYVNVKGIIPIHETLLPKTLSIPGTDRTFPVDVREGGMISFSSPNEHHQHLKMGCQISDRKKSGTLGPIIESDMKCYCLTCAHLFCENQAFRDQIAVSGVYKKASDNGHGNILVYQGECPPFGFVDEAVYKSGGGQTAGLDVAVINITDLERLPNEGSFPDGNMNDADTGYDHHSPMRYTTGNVYDEQCFREQTRRHNEVVKYGSETGYTKGKFDMLGQVVKIDYTNQYGHPEFTRIMCNQLHVLSMRDPRICPFAKAGDSGSLVFAKHNGDPNDLWAVGMVIGGTTYKTYVVTPIWDILYHLRHLNGGLKPFEA